MVTGMGFRWVVSILIGLKWIFTPTRINQQSKSLVLGLGTSKGECFFYPRQLILCSSLLLMFSFVILLARTHTNKMAAGYALLPLNIHGTPAADNWKKFKSAWTNSSRIKQKVRESTSGYFTYSYWRREAWSICDILVGKWRWQLDKMYILFSGRYFSFWEERCNM